MTRDAAQSGATNPPDFLNDLPQTGASETTLSALRAKVAEGRDLRLEIADIKARLEEREGELTKLETVTLPDMLQAAGLDRIGVDATANMPAYDAELEDVVRASIASSWPEEKRQAAFKTLEDRGAASLIKTAVVFEFEREDRDTAKEFLAKAEELGFIGEEKLSVHAQTLGAWLRAECNADRVPPKSVIDAIGGYIGKIVKIKPRKTRK